MAPPRASICSSATCRATTCAAGAQKDGVTTFRKPCNKSNGLAWDRQGRLIVCEHATSHLTRTEADGTITVLASHHDGKELNSPNDVVVKSDGAIYFSDPTYGRKEHFGVPREPQLAFRGVYRVAPDGKTLTLLADDFGQPNGLCFSLDEKVLFVNDTDRQHIRAFDVKADGTLANNRIWAKTVGDGAGAPDGMKIDSAGNVYSLRTRRHPRVRARCHLPRRDQGAGVHRQFLLGRRRLQEPVHHRFQVDLPHPRRHVPGNGADDVAATWRGSGRRCAPPSSVRVYWCWLVGWTASTRDHSEVDVAFRRIGNLPRHRTRAVPKRRASSRRHP